MGSPRMSSTASTIISAMAPNFTMSVAAVPATARWMIVRITRHGDPIDTMSLARDDCLSMADPPMATAAPAVTAKPAPSAARRGTSRRHWRPRMSMSAMASPTPTSAAVTLTANPRPTRTPAANALLAGGTTPQDPPDPGGTHPPRPPLGGTSGPPMGHGPNITATAATPKTTAWPSTCAPATSTWSSSGLQAHSRAARSCCAGSWRVIRCSSSAVTAKAARFARPSTNTVSRTEVPPTSEASPWIAVASGP